MDEPLNIRITSAVAAETGTDPLGLPPLNDAVDVEALEALFETCENREQGCDLEFRFDYAGREVLVRSDGVTLDEPAADRSSES